MLELIPVALTIVTAAGYAAALARLYRRGHRWPASRVVGLLAGSACVCAAVLPPVASHDEYFPVHVGQHLLLGQIVGHLHDVEHEICIFIATDCITDCSSTFLVGGPPTPCDPSKNSVRNIVIVRGMVSSHMTEH